MVADAAQRRYYASMVRKGGENIILSFPRKRVRDAFIVRAYPRASILAAAMRYAFPARYPDIRMVDSIDEAMQIFRENP